MPGRPRIRPAVVDVIVASRKVSGPRVGPKLFRHGVLKGHSIATVDPILASVLNSALWEHVAPSTRRCYTSAIKSYVDFCAVRSVDPFPVDAVWLAAWCVWAAMAISVNSIKVYLAAIRSAHIDTGVQ